MRLLAGVELLRPGKVILFFLEERGPELDWLRCVMMCIDCSGFLAGVRVRWFVWDVGEEGLGAPC